MIHFFADIHVVVAEPEILTFHAINTFQGIEIQALGVIDVPEADVFPKFTSKQNTRENQGPPVGEANLDPARGHDLFEVN